MLSQKLLSTIRRHHMLTPGQHIAVAVSGGADSVCLLHLLLELGHPLSVLHVNHNLRGPDSGLDADFVRALAVSHNLPFHLREVNLARTGNLEQHARDARLHFFREILSTGAADRVATAHTQNDQAETVLYRFLRGAGPTGLTAIQPVTPEGIIRPLLDCTRAEIESYLVSRNLPWRTDATNADPRFDRNRIRHHLLPQLARDWNPQITATLARTASLAQAEEDYWTTQIAALAPTCFSGPQILNLSAFRTHPLPLRRRLIRHAIHQTKTNLRAVDFDHIESILALAESPKGHGHVHLPGIRITRSFDQLLFSSASQRLDVKSLAPIQLLIPSIVPLPRNRTLSLELIEKRGTSPTCYSVYNNEVDWALLSGALHCRSWKPGDRYQPIAAGNVEKVKMLFQKARVPLWERREWPILLDGDSIVWVRQFGAAAQFAAGPQTATVLRIQELDGVTVS